MPETISWLCSRASFSDAEAGSAGDEQGIGYDHIPAFLSRQPPVSLWSISI
jgi:hypothetical protein